MSKILLIAMLAGSALDVGTTEVGLRHPGLHESNPLMTHQGVRVTVNVVAPFVLYHMIKDKPTKTQLAVALPWIGLKTFAGIHNIRLIRRHHDHH